MSNSPTSATRQPLPEGLAALKARKMEKLAQEKALREARAQSAPCARAGAQEAPAIKACGLRGEFAKSQKKRHSPFSLGGSEMKENYSPDGHGAEVKWAVCEKKGARNAPKSAAGISPPAN